MKLTVCISEKVHQYWKLLFRVCDISCSQICPCKLTYKCLKKAPLQERAAVFSGFFWGVSFGGKRGLEWWNTHVLIHQLFSHSSLLIASLAVAVQHNHIITDYLALRVSVSVLVFSVLFATQMYMHGLTFLIYVSHSIPTFLKFRLYVQSQHVSFQYSSKIRAFVS